MPTLLIKQRTFFLLIVLILTTQFISSCSTQPKIKEVTNTKNNTTKEVTVGKSAKETLALAATQKKQLSDDPQIQARQLAEINNLLIEASELFLQEQNYPKALWLANELSQTHQDNLQNSYRLLLVKAQSLQSLNYLPQALKQLELLKELVDYSKENTQDSLSLTFNYYQILETILTLQNRSVAALDAKLHAFSLNPQSSIDDIQAIWSQFAPLTQWQISQLQNNNPPYIKGWSKLLYYCQRYGESNNQLVRYLNRWKQSYATHPATSIIEQIQNEHLMSSADDISIQNIVILLPLSGNQKNAGLAAQQGLLAAYQNNNETNIYFIDTNTVNWDELVTTISALNVDHIVGPLLKTNVEKFLALSSQETVLQVPTILLNISSQYSLTEYQTALSMRPEDEAEQAAETLSQQQYKKPIILSHNDSVSKRIALAFSKRWQISSGTNVDIVYFDEGKQMQVNLKESLDVNASQSRIKQLNDRLQNTIKSEARNRRDIDMIYLVGSAAQTRLIKPYIDVNISPFAEIIPVYASSRSHSHFHDKHSTSSTNDLAGLTFTQIPWLLDSEFQNKDLIQLSEQLWPKRTDSLSRIFAMGYDSYQLLSKIELMKESPYVRHFGQTGILKLNGNNLITRSLLWGQYKNDKVMQVVMD